MATPKISAVLRNMTASEIRARLATAERIVESLGATCESYAVELDSAHERIEDLEDTERLSGSRAVVFTRKTAMLAKPTLIGNNYAQKLCEVVEEARTARGIF